MYTIFVVLIILASVLMCVVVLIQESKGGGLAADYASGNTLLGAPKTTDIIKKVTAWLAAAMVLLCVFSTAFLPETKAVDSVLQLEQPAAAPVLPTVPATDATPTTTTTPQPAEAPSAN
ncbi:MAG: preprotein translocase subunit SecG [Bacteroidaceae bacterium]|nr:preprotein translocase subunit SecG [Bacteroidaceae bacterium]